MANCVDWRRNHILKEEAMTKRASYDIFLSHSYDDRKIILGAKRFIESKGYSVFVDWIEEPQLNRNKVNKATAAALRTYIDIFRCLIYAYSPNVGNSKWCPWELGYFDGKNGRAYVMPIIDDPLQSYTGVEYVNLYPNVTEEQAPGFAGRAVAPAFAALRRGLPSPLDPVPGCRVSALRASILAQRTIAPLAGGTRPASRRTAALC
jgi:hypothetical protein